MQLRHCPRFSKAYSTLGQLVLAAHAIALKCVAAWNIPKEKPISSRWRCKSRTQLDYSSHHVEMQPWWIELEDPYEGSLRGWSMDDDVIFHYTSADTLKEILRSGNIRLSPLSQTNDPLERRERSPMVIVPAPTGELDPEVQIEVAERLEEIANATDHHLRRGARIACFCEDQEPTADFLPGSHFHRGWARARMWDQYGHRHSGACLVFKKFDLVSAIDDGVEHADGDLFAPGKVLYQDHPTTTVLDWEEIRTLGIEQVLDREQSRRFAANELYLRKVRDWESEQEYRIVFVRWDPAPDEIDSPIDIPFQLTLVAVILGQEFPDDEVPEIRELLEPHGDVELWRCRWESGNPTLFPE